MSGGQHWGIYFSGHVINDPLGSGWPFLKASSCPGCPLAPVLQTLRMICISLIKSYKGWMDGPRMERWMEGWMNGWMDGWMVLGWMDNIRMDGRMDGYIGGWMNGWMGERSVFSFPK